MRSQLEKISLVNTSDLSETLTFSVVQEGAAEASRQVLSIEPADGGEVIIEDSQRIITSKMYNITVTGFYSASAITQLETWQTNQTEITFTGYGIGGQILQATGTLTYQEDYEDNVSFRFNSMREATGGYSDLDGEHTAKLSYNRNGLAYYKWGDADADGLANGWSKTGGTTTFSSGVQNFTTTASGGAELSRTIYFPFGGKVLTFSADLVINTATTGISVEIEAYDNTDTLSDSNSEVASGDGRLASQLTLPSDTEYVIVKVNIGQDDDVDISDPVLGIGSYQTFTEFNT